MGARVFVFGDFRCSKCGHEYKLEAIHPVVEGDKLVSAYFSSRKDFCPKCDGVPEYVGAHYEGEK